MILQCRKNVNLLTMKNYKFNIGRIVTFEEVLPLIVIHNIITSVKIIKLFYHTIFSLFSHSNRLYLTWSETCMLKQKSSHENLLK